jgi:hypothetical protein
VKFGSVERTRLAGLDAEPEGPVALPIESLRGALSPRLGGVDEAHARVLAELGDTLPPIVVQRSSMRVVDGMHRLRAAQLRGQHQVDVHFFDGGDDDAYLHAITANITHGLPLSMADRKHAATHLLRRYPHWSDRAVAKAAGLSGKTVGVLRRELIDELPVGATRLGRDGRVRRVVGASTATAGSEWTPAVRPPDSDWPERRSSIADDFNAEPATASGPRPSRDFGLGRTARPNGGRPLRTAAADTADPRSLLNNLTRDPSLRYTNGGRALLRWLYGQLTCLEEERRALAGAAPPHCLPTIARLARHCGAAWHQLADELDQRVRGLGA